MIFLKKIFESTETDNIPELLPMLVVESPPSQPYFTQDNQVDEYTIKKKYLSPLECQNAFLQEIGCKTDRPIRNYPQLICKPDFIIHHINECTIVPSEMLIADRQTLFSPQFAIYNNYHHPFRDGCVPRPQKNPALIHERCSNFALRKVKEEKNRYLFEEILNRFKPDTQNNLIQFWEFANNLVTYWRKLSDEDESRCLLKRVNDVLINVKQKDSLIDNNYINSLTITELNENTVISFVHECLLEYLHAYNNIMLINKDPMTGHFKPTCTNIDYDFAWRYTIECEKLRTIREQLAKLWPSLEYPFDAGESFNIDSLPGGQSAFTATTFEQVQKNICQYFTDAAQEALTKLSSSQIEFIIKKLEQTRKKLFPFRTLVLCIVKGGIFFKKPCTLEMEAILDFPNHIYRSKPSVAIQRVKRLRLLFALCQTCELAKTDIEQNILLFLKYHGVVPQSEEEFVMWDDFLREHHFTDSPVSLPLRYANALNKCLSLQFDQLVCFNSCSALHMGGFSALIKYKPDILHEYTSMEHQKTIPKTLCYEYLRLWASASLNVDAMKSICLEIVKKLDWTLLNELDGWIDQYKFGIPLNHIDLNELKLLLSEIAVRCSLQKKAKKLLHQSLTKNELIWRVEILKSGKTKKSESNTRTGFKYPSRF